MTSLTKIPSAHSALFAASAVKHSSPWRSWRPWRFVFLLLVTIPAARGQCPGGMCPVSDVAPVARGEQVAPGPLAAVSCRIYHFARGVLHCGSGTVVQLDDEHYVLTCNHIFGGMDGRITCEFVDGTKIRAEMIDADAGHDLALLKLAQPRSSIASLAKVQTEELLTACGFGTTGKLRALRGPLVGYAATEGARYSSLQIATTVMSGDSGGGVFDTQQRLCGVIWGVRDGIAYATPLEPIRQLLSRIAQRDNDNDQATTDQPAASTVDSHAAWRAGVDTRLAQLAERIDNVQKLVPDPLAQAPAIDPLPRVEQKLGTWRDEVLGEARTAAGTVAGAVVREGLKKLPTAMGYTLPQLVIGGASIGTPVGVGLLAIGYLWRRHAAKPRAAKSIAVDSPPVTQAVAPETHYVPYETQTFPDAYQWASGQVARKFPGAVETLTTLDSLIKQQLSSRE